MAIKYDHFTFSGGEEQITLEEMGATFVHRIESSQDLIKLGLIMEAKPEDHMVSVMIPYFPYARQDRVMNNGEAHALRFVCNYLKSLGFYKIFTHDIHSDVAFGILPNLINIPRHEVLRGKENPDGSFDEPWEGARDYDAIVSPDGGALKHVYQDAAALGVDTVYTGMKHRDVTTGEITKTEVNLRESITGQKVLITDDICDGGRTFIELSKVLKETWGAKTVDLYVTHGIFSKGLITLHGTDDGLIDHVITTDTRSNASLQKANSFCEDSKKYTILPIIGELK